MLPPTMRPPFRRLVVALLALAAALARAEPPPPEKTLFLVRGGDGVVSAIRAQSFTPQGNVIVIVSDTGSRAVVQPRSIVGRLPLYDDATLAGGTVELTALAATYRAYARSAGEARTFLLREADRFERLQKARLDEAAARERAVRDRIARAIAPVYDENHPYRPDELDALLAEAEAVGTAHPEAATRLDAWAAPFRAHREHLQSGDEREDGVWVTRAEREAREQTRRQTEFQRSLDYPISGLALAPDVPRPAVRLGLGLPAALAALGLALAVLGRRRAALRRAGVALLTLAPLAAAGGFFLLTRTPANLPPGGTPPDDRPVIAALAFAAQAGPVAAPPAELSEAALNAFLARRVRLTFPAAADAPGAARRLGLVARLQPDRILLFELLGWAGRQWIVRYTLSLHADKLTLERVDLGTLPCPPALAQALWSSLEPELRRVLARTGLTQAFTLQLADGHLRLTPTIPVPAPAASSPDPAPTPPPATPTPAPVATATPVPADAPAPTPPSATPAPPAAPTPTPTPTPPATPPPAPSATPANPTANPFARHPDARDRAAVRA